MLRNHADADARVLTSSEVPYPSPTVFPDSDRVGRWTRGDRQDDLLVRRSSRVDLYDGEV